METVKNTEPLTIRVIDGSECYRDDIFALCNERYGTGYLRNADFDRWMMHPSLLKIALIDEKFAGFAVMVPAEVPEIMKKMAMPEQDVLRIAGGKPALIYKSAAVRIEYEHRGVMRAMATRGIEEAREQGYGSLFGSAWVYDGKIPIEPTFRAFGFQRLYERKMLWYDDEEYHCAVCGGRCTCDAVIYYKIL